MHRTVSFALNGEPVRLETDDERMLLWVLRQDLGLTGTKYGCGEALCGSCTVIVDGQAIRSCATALKEVQGKKVLTVEGLAKGNSLHPLQQAFVRHNAFQCGFCTSGMLMSAYALLLAIPRPSEAAIIEHMDNNLCRCGSHVRVVQAIRAAAASMKGAGQ